MNEAYCIVCRRMVPARRRLTGGVFVLAVHYRFDLSQGKDFVPCSGKITSSPITHGEEDPKAAFRYSRRAWGPIFTKDPFSQRVVAYVD